jgi:DNA-binding response OmpR family regulator
MQSRSYIPRVLIVEDDAAVSERIATYLTREGYGTSTVETVAQMRSTIEGTKVDIVILDVSLPGEDGWSALRWLRAQYAVPVLMLMAKGDTVDRVNGLELSADDYVTKPFDLRELRARLHSIQRRFDKVHAQQLENTPEVIQFADWTLDIANQRLRSDSGEAEHLTQMEHRILALLARNPRKAVSRDQLMDAMVGRNWEALDRSVDVHICSLRRKIDPDPKQPSLVRTVRGVGYMFVPGGGS